MLTRTAIGPAMLQTGGPRRLELPDKAWFDAHELLSAARVLGYEHPDIANLFQVFSETVAAPGRPGVPGSEAASPDPPPNHQNSPHQALG